MLIYFSESLNERNATASEPLIVPMGKVLEIYRNLDAKLGFLGIQISPAHTIEFHSKTEATVRVELLDSFSASFDTVVASATFGETLIRAAEEARDVFDLARKSLSGWEQVELIPKRAEGQEGYPKMPVLKVESVEFTATEAGYDGKIGGASNAKSESMAHYLLFGKQIDPQHAWNSGIYFEYDNQRNRRVNSVNRLAIGDDVINFFLVNGGVITVRRGVSEHEWARFKTEIGVVFSKVDFDRDSV